MRRPVAALCLLLGACSSDSDRAPAPAAAAPGGVALQRVFPRLSFDQPLFLAAAPGQPQRLFVVTQPGVIYVFERTADPATATVFIDLRDRVLFGGEQGLLGLAFHPAYADNGTFYAYYTAASPRRQIVARFQAGADRITADPATQQVLFEMADPYSNHNGGMLAFGPDGMLYIGTGDGGSAGDPLDSGQRLDTLLGKILRVTPDGGVPADNPFVNTAGARGEIWAYGLRNPWRFSFDRATGALWAADVGQNAWEEIDVITRGGNYGWRLYEGAAPFNNPANRPASAFVAPVLAYGHDLGCSVTGGYVYRGTAVPALAGHYVYADYCSGRVWALAQNGGAPATRQIGLVSGPSSFGEDAAGELYVTSFDGGIYQIVP